MREVGGALGGGGFRRRGSVTVWIDNGRDRLRAKSVSELAT